MTVPVVIDTDIGTDIDDTWALALAMRSAELDVRLVTTVSGDPWYRARVARGVIGPGVPIAVGLGGGRDVRATEPQRGIAVDDAFLDDGVGALVGACREPVTIVALGPLTNLAAALHRDPSIAKRARVVAMAGSVHVGYRGEPGAVPEYNVAVDVPACRAVLGAPWDVTLVPVDTCGSIVLRDEQYRRLFDADDPMVARVLSTYREWLVAADRLDLFERRSTTLFDTLAVHLAHDESLVEIEEVPIAVDDDGTMRITEGAPVVRAAIRWRDEAAFHALLAARLAGE